MGHLQRLSSEAARPPPGLEAALTEYVFHSAKGHGGAPPVELAEAWFYQALWREFGVPMHIAERLDYRRSSDRLEVLRVWREKVKDASGD